MAYRGSYERSIDYGFAMLEQLEGPEGQVQYNPQDGDDWFTDIYMTGFYGGQIHPDEPAHFLVYDLDFPEDSGPVDDALVAMISEELDSMFSGWAIDETTGKVYVVDARAAEDIAHER